jgi:hypothetical protein
MKTTTTKMVETKSTVIRKQRNTNPTMTTTSRLWLVLERTGWLLLLYLVLVQGPSAVIYEWGVTAGVQESVEKITPIGVAFNIACARADVVVYIPLLAAGLVGYHGGHGQRKEWGRVCLAAAVGMTLYWTFEYMFVLPVSRSSWNLGDETAYWVFLPIIALWAIFTLGYLATVVQVPEEQPPKQRVEFQSSKARGRISHSGY